MTSFSPFSRTFMTLKTCLFYGRRNEIWRNGCIISMMPSGEILLSFMFQPTFRERFKLENCSCIKKIIVTKIDFSIMYTVTPDETNKKNKLAEFSNLHCCYNRIFPSLLLAYFYWPTRPGPYKWSLFLRMVPVHPSVPKTETRYNAWTLKQNKRRRYWGLVGH